MNRREFVKMAAAGFCLPLVPRALAGEWTVHAEMITDEAGGKSRAALEALLDAVELKYANRPYFVTRTRYMMTMLENVRLCLGTNADNQLSKAADNSSWLMQEGGLTVDLSKLGAGKRHEINNQINRDPALGAGVMDGGLTIRGPNDRAFYAASSLLRFYGPIRVEGGYAHIMCARTNDLYVASGATVTMRELDTGSVGDFTGSGAVTNAVGHKTGVLNVYGTFHSQGAVIDHLALKPGAAIACDGANIATVSESLTIDKDVKMVFEDAVPEKGTVIQIADVSSLQEGDLDYPSRVYAALNGETTDRRVRLFVENGVLCGEICQKSGFTFYLR